MRNIWGAKAREFERVMLPHLADVYRFARQMSDEQRAPDLVQETYLRAWKYFDSFERGTNCRGWLFRILHNVWADQWRRERLETSPLEENDGAVEPYYDWEDEFIRDEMSPEFERALARLPATHRWAVLLADVEELTYREIADVMNCPVGTVMSRVNRGRRTLGRLLRSDVQAREHDAGREEVKSHGDPK